MTAPTAVVGQTQPRAHPQDSGATPALWRISRAIGEVLLTLAVIAGLFFVWQVWWTSRDTHTVAATQVTGFRAALAPAPLDAAPLRTDDPPVPEAPPTGEMLGVLVVPAWQGLTLNEMPILEGTSAAVLNQAAAGHFTDTQMVGQVGNFALAGHRRSYGNSFRYVNELKPGDQIIVETPETWYVYEVTGSELVLPDRGEVISPVPHQPRATPSERLLTLVTCHSVTLGEFGNDHRWVTYATFLGWTDRQDGPPDQIAALVRT